MKAESPYFLKKMKKTILGTLIFTYHGNTVWCKSAFWLLKTRIYKYARGFLECYNQKVPHRWGQSWQSRPQILGNAN